MLSATASLPTVDHSDLCQHLQQCADARGRLHRLRCTVEVLDAFLAPRFVTMLGAMTLLVLAGLALLT
ncbi:MAG: hypothetical protein ABJB17_10695 [Burkholderiales bacterium]